MAGETPAPRGRAKVQLHPIHVRWSDVSKKWVVISGERRWRACCQLCEYRCANWLGDRRGVHGFLSAATSVANEVPRIVR